MLMSNMPVISEQSVKDVVEVYTPIFALPQHKYDPN